MNRQPAPCSACARFRPGETDGTCTGYEKPRRADDTNEACPLWSERKAETRPFRARAHDN